MKKGMTLEKAMDRLEEITLRMHDESVTMDESLKLFEEGTVLVASCSKMLDEAEQKVVKLKKGSDRSPVEIPFEEE